MVSLDSSIGQLISRRNQLKRKVSLPPQRLLRGPVKTVLVRVKESLGNSTEQSIPSRNQLKRKVSLPSQNLLWGSVKAAPVRVGSFVIDRANRIGAAFPTGRSFFLGILAGCVQRVFVQTMLNYYDFGYFRPFSSPYTKALLEVHDYTDLCALLYFMLGAPLLEEVIFRKTIQRNVASITKSPVAGIAVSAVLFWTAHLGNPHKNGAILAVAAGLGGVTFGILNHQLGLAASIGAHIAHNSFYRLAYWWGVTNLSQSL